MINVPTVVLEKKYTAKPTAAPRMKIMFRMFLINKNWSCSLSTRLCLLCGYCVSMYLLLVLLMLFD